MSRNYYGAEFQQNFDQGLVHVALLNVPLSKDYKHTWFFESVDEQYNHFDQQEYKVATAWCTYQRKDQLIRFPDRIENIQFANYVRYTDKYHTYYAFISDMKFMSPDRTDIIIETDVFQTWMFNAVINPCFVEREHVDSDAVGEHTIEEGLQIGEYKCEQATDIFTSNFKVVVGLSRVLFEGDGKFSRSGVYNKLFSGLCFRAFDYTEEGIQKLNHLLFLYDDAGMGDDVVCMFLAPSALCPTVSYDDYADLGDGIIAGSVAGPADDLGGWVPISREPYTMYINTTGKVEDGGVEDADYSTVVFSRPFHGNYRPKNNKLFVYPYRYLLISNNNGANAVYRFEDFYKSEYIEDTPADGGHAFTYIPIEPTFLIEGALCVGCSIRMVPLHYKGVKRNDEEGINLGKFPSLNWTSDTYTNWITQNGINVGVSVATNAIATVASIAAAPATGGASLMGAVSGLAGIANTVGEISKASMAPAQTNGNTNNGDIITVSGKNNFQFYTMGLKEETAKIIDHFFDLFGYKINLVKVPNKNHREHYWYTKTIDATVTGNVPAKDKEIMEKCYNNGITFWKKDNVPGDYPESNPIVERN